MPRLRLRNPRSWLGTAVEPRAARAADRAPWRGPTRRYDIIKEGTIASVVILALTFGLAGLLSSPDVPPVTIQSWAQVAPADFPGTAAIEPARHPAPDTGASPDLAVTLGRTAAGAGHDAATAGARRARRGRLNRVTPASARVPLARAA
jgi:hypothetical protein